MHLKDYIPLAIRTESPRMLGNIQLTSRLLHSAIGISTEVAELFHHTDATNLKEELGDIMWYIAIGFDAIHVSIPNEFRPVSTRESSPKARLIWMQTLIKQSGELLDLMKKHAFYGKALDQWQAKCLLVDILGLVIELCATDGIDLGEVMEANIRKLRSRYPQKFEDALALSRDLVAENKALEG
jgi:NTP pyrophosphatase (non-canonical NTP hydrolase)